MLLGDLAVLRHGLLLVEDEVPHFRRHVLGLDAVLVALVPFEGAALEGLCQRWSEVISQCSGDLKGYSLIVKCQSWGEVTAGVQGDR